MATPFPDNGTASTAVFATSAFLARIEKIALKGVKRKVIDFTHMGSTVSEFKPGDLVDNGQLELDVQWDTKQATANIPPISGAVETVTITLPVPSGLTNGATVVGTAFLETFDMEDPMEDKITAKCVFKWAGAVAFAAAS